MGACEVDIVDEVCFVAVFLRDDSVNNDHRGAVVKIILLSLSPLSIVHCRIVLCFCTECWHSKYVSIRMSIRFQIPKRAVI